MLTVTFCLVLGAFVLTLFAADGKPTLWCAVVLLCLVHLLQLLPR